VRVEVRSRCDLAEEGRYGEMQVRFDLDFDLDATSRVRSGWASV